MPYKDKEYQKLKNREYQKLHYQNNRDYYKSKAKERKKELRKFISDLKKTLKCNRCPENDTVCLDFHHKDPQEKEIEISQVYRKGWGKARILKEIAKCEVLCANCHRKEHAHNKIIAG